MNNIPIFDCLTHPSIDGNWISQDHQRNNGIDILIQDMKNNNIKWAFAVGMAGIGSYDVNLYSQFVTSKSSSLFPVAYFNLSSFSCIESIKEELLNIKQKNYVGIKIHPRFSGITLNNKLLAETVKIANHFNLLVMLCTYFYDDSNVGFKNNTVSLIELLSKVKEEKIILLHSGTVRLLEFAEIARVFPNVLLDLSFTICKYEGSSIDQDIRYLFNNFDRRICLGSDNPEFSLKKLRERFNYFSIGIKEEKLENIAFKNLWNFWGVDNDIARPR